MAQMIGHERVVDELRQLAALEEAPHALLLTGPEHTGRALLAQHYAALLNCELRSVEGSAWPCGECRACRLILEGHHPDVTTVEPGDVLCRPREGEAGHARHPDSRDIRICQVRGLLELVAHYPFEARVRTILIDPAERMNRDAANTLLKTLEEPPSHTVFVLISAAPEALPETIVSRCRRLEVMLVDRETIERGLVARGVEAGLAADAARSARGRPGIAIQFAEQPGLLGDRERLLGRCAEVVRSNLRERVRYAGQLGERWRGDRAGVAPELDAWEAFWEGEMRRAAEVSDSDAARGALDGLRAVRRVREDLLAQVTARLAFEVMILSFPRSTLGDGLEERSPEGAYA